MTVAILTISDKGARGERKDESGKVALELITKLDAKLARYDIIPDEAELIREKLVDYSDKLRVDLVLTTGGTGFSPRDKTPEATLAVLERQAPGISELMRFQSYKKTPKAALSRGVSGIRKSTMIVNLPGSPKAVRECLEAILPILPHAISVLKGEAGECGESRDAE
ncbi:MAG: MogA/MoaB family molybdenum cofactor biosynthesis protein [Candidatus Eisenbacteria bacterium]|nr:MogA/MoaB family molybdenum cofactor biosynthesis protein [Candidatus Eisenbacteria bacterium]